MELVPERSRRNLVGNETGRVKETRHALSLQRIFVVGFWDETGHALSLQGFFVGFGNETGRALSLQGIVFVVFGILYFGGVSKFRNKYLTESIRASWWDYGRKGLVI